MEPFFTWHRLRRSLLALLCLYLFADLNGQTISLNVKDEKITKVFASIEQQTSIRFVYTTEGISKAKNVTLTLDRASVESALEKLFAGQPLFYSRDGQYVSVKAKPPVTTSTSTPAKPVVSNEPLIIRGTITDESQLPVAGAVVQISPAGATTMSDESGNFSLEVAEANTRLMISRAEMVTQEVVVKAPASLSLTMIHKIGSLDETYVIAYGRSSKRLGTGTVSSIKRAEIEKQPVSNPLAALAVRVSGLEITQQSGTPGSAFRVRLRGQNSMASGNDPLIIVDGIPFPFNPIGFTVAGGVTVSPLAILNPSDIESIEVLKDADATAIYGSRGANGVIYITTRKAGAGKIKLHLRHTNGWGRTTGQLELLKTPAYIALRREAYRNDGTNPTLTNGADLLVWDTTRYTDWQDVLTGSTAHTSDTKLEVSGGSANTQFLFGLGYRRESTTLPVEQFGEKKYSANMQVTHKTSDGRIAISLSSAFSRNNTHLPQADITSYITLPPNAPAIYDSAGNLNWERSTWTNPFAVLKQAVWTESENLLNNASITLQVLSGLEVKMAAGYSVTRLRGRTATPMAASDPGRSSSNSASFTIGSVQTIILEPQLAYKFKAARLNGSIQAGWTGQSDRRLLLTQQGSNYASDALLGSIKAATNISIGTDNDILYRYSGLFSRINLDWAQTYLLNLTLRRDGSSRYGPENRFANFYSVGAGWIFTNTSWLKDNKILTFGKFRTSYGISGNDQIGDYNYYDLYSPMRNPYQGITPFQPVQLYNPQFSWELVNKWEAGLDLGLVRSINLSFRHYRNRTDNQLLQYGLPPSSGFESILRNLPARISNTGWEFEANASIIQHKNFEWSASINVTIPRNELVRFDNLAASTYANTYVIGEPLTISKRYKYTGIDAATGNYTVADLNGDGRISAPIDQQIITFVGLQSFGGLENSFRWKKLSFSFVLQFAEQRYATNYTSRFNRPGSLSNQPVYVEDRWRKPGDIAAIQKVSAANSANLAAFNNFRLSDGSFSDASFIRLRTLYLSYDLLSPLLRKAGFTSCNIFLQGQNLVTITKYRGLDPETKSFLPPVKLLTAGLQVTL